MAIETEVSQAEYEAHLEKERLVLNTNFIKPMRDAGWLNDAQADYLMGKMWLIDGQLQFRFNCDKSDLSQIEMIKSIKNVFDRWAALRG